MRIRTLLVTGVVGLGLLAGALVGPAQAAPRKLEGFITTPQAPAWVGLTAGETGLGSDTLTAAAFGAACQQDREAYAAGDAAGATHVAEFLTSDENGLDAYVFDLGKPTEGAFAAEGPGATELVPDATGNNLAIRDYDLDIDFFTTPDVNAADYDHLDGGLGCPNANRVTSDHKCYAHKPDAHEKTGCVNGYKVGKVKHLPRYAMISGSFNVKGPMTVILTAP